MPDHAPRPEPAPPAADATRLARLRQRPRPPGQAAMFFHDAHFRYDAVKVLPGEYFATDEDLMITTTLGSCVAACLWDRRRGVGGLNHFMLPDGAPGTVDAGRYGTHAMGLLIDEMIRLGAGRATMEAKVFGGAAVISGMDSLNVGESNVRFVLAYLRAEGIPVVSQDVLDVHPRKVCYLPATGKAMVKRLAIANTEALLAQERAAAAAAAAGDARRAALDPFGGRP